MAGQHRHGPPAPLDCVIIRASSSCNHRRSSGHGPTAAWRSSSMRWSCSWPSPCSWVMLTACARHPAESRSILAVEVGDFKRWQNLWPAPWWGGWWGGPAGSVELCGRRAAAALSPWRHLHRFYSLARLEQRPHCFDPVAALGWCEDLYVFLHNTPPTTSYFWNIKIQIDFRRRIKKNR